MKTPIQGRHFYHRVLKVASSDFTIQLAHTDSLTATLLLIQQASIPVEKNTAIPSHCMSHGEDGWGPLHCPNLSTPLPSSSSTRQGISLSLPHPEQQ